MTRRAVVATIGGSGDRTTIRGLTALLIAAPIVMTGLVGDGASASGPPAATAPHAAIADVATEGQWSGVLPWVDRAVNAHVLPTGKVMYWPAWFGDAPARLWDPATGLTVDAPFAGYNIFCTGEVFLADGRMFVAGGSVDNVNPFGTKNTSIYDPFANTWTTLPEMAQARWYPTTTVLSDGNVLVVSGENHHAHRSLLPQVWQTEAGSYRNLTSAEKWLPLYPWMYLAPNGKVFNAGPNGWTSYLDTNGTGTWDPPIARSNFGDRDIGEGTYGSSAMYRDGKILIMGGSDPATATAEVIDLNAAMPTWRYVAPMASPRKQHVATILPDGKVLVVGGHSGPGKDNPAYPVYPAELWDPATETWTTLASMATYRGYHSSAFVLPDGRVVSAGGEDVGANAEIFSPPYLFRGSRPRIAAAPDRVSYGQTFSVSSPDAASVARVTLLRLPSITHGFDQNQRFAELTFSRGAGGLSATAPTDPNLAPAGHYMLYLLNSAGVPSVAKIIRLDERPFPAPSAASSTSAARPRPPRPPRPSQRRRRRRRSSRSRRGRRVSARSRRRGAGESTCAGRTAPPTRPASASSARRTASRSARSRRSGRDATAYANTNLTAGTRYWYRVRAYNAAGAVAAVERRQRQGSVATRRRS